MSNEVNRFIGKAVQKRITYRNENPGSTPPLLIGFANVQVDIGPHRNQDAIRKDSRSISTADEQVYCRFVYSHL